MSRAISDAGWAEFGRMLAYKTQWYGSELRVIDRFAPSSKTCSDCGAINKALRLSDRVWVCEACGCIHDRDDNASINIREFGLNDTGSHRPESEASASRACGDRISKRRSMKQEASTPRCQR
ncbi:MAG TPA: transposase [Verrucomicrobiae bacterium]|nr:transposase [Verrucomicrobiae bacterium]